MRQIILDTETTGLDPNLGHRIIEIAGVELFDRRLTGNHFHRYINPGRESDAAALQVHGLTSEFLRDKPKFSEVAQEFLEYVRGAELIIHNAPFDISFLNMELGLLNEKAITIHCPAVIDTLRMAKEIYPGKRNSLDALCDRYGIDNSARTLHGALLDAQLLAEVYLSMTRGQNSLMIDVDAPKQTVTVVEIAKITSPLVVVQAGPEEMTAHDEWMADLNKASGGKCIWIAEPPVQ